MTSEFPSNRHKDKAQLEKKPDEKKVTQVTQNEVVRRRKPLGKRLTETFVGGDAKSVWAFVLLDVVVPTTKDMIADVVTQGAERMIFGETRSTSRRGSRGSSGPHIAYNRYSNTSKRLGPPDERSRDAIGLSRRARTLHDFDEVILETRVEALEVIERLEEIIHKYESATVADLYDLIGVSRTFTDDKWGWFDLSTAGVSRTRHGYLLDLPKPESLD